MRLINIDKHILPIVQILGGLLTIVNYSHDSMISKKIYGLIGMGGSYDYYTTLINIGF